MSHLHIPDGIISLWLWVLGYIIVGIYFLFFSLHLKKSGNYKKLAVTAVFGALMLLAMSIPIPIVLPYHINLSVLAGILVGPLYAGIAIFCDNLILSFLGHGGISIVGLNTVILTIEATVGFFLFKLISKKFNKVFSAAFISTMAALVISTALTVGVVFAGTQNLENLAHKHCDHEHLEQHEDELQHEEHHEHDERFDLRRFLVLILITGSIGWTMEAFITAFIVNYINRVKPDLLSGSLNENN